LQTQFGHAQQIAASQAQQYANPAIEMGASLALDRIKEKYPDAFGRYASEIYQQLANVPIEQIDPDTRIKVAELSGALSEREARGLLGQCEELERHLQGVRRAPSRPAGPGADDTGTWPAPRPRARG
jgi:hypothetical protein